MSETNTPASTFTSVTGNETNMLAKEIKKYDTAKLIARIGFGTYAGGF